jgi:DNA modification methylase
MEPVFDRCGVRLFNGDCLDVLKTLPDESVHCCVTSPPYFGLRDYGTGTWVGGDPRCPHKPTGTTDDPKNPGSTARNGKPSARDREILSGRCPCGAVKVDRQIGLEPTPDEFVAKLVAVFREVRRVLRADGTLWINLGDSYANDAKGPGAKAGNLDGRPNLTAVQKSWRLAGDLKKKDLIGIPWMTAFALRADGWYLRQELIWAKPNPMPESVTDRCTKAHEHIFLLSKSPRYYFDAEAVKEKAVSDHPAGNKNHKYADQYEAERAVTQQHRTKAGLKSLAGVKWEKRNRRSVWTVNTKSYRGAHFATFPPDLIEPCILAGCPGTGRRCDCGEVIATPTGEGAVDDPSMLTGRAGFNRPRREGEGCRTITRREQRHEAAEMKQSPHRVEMGEACGPAFAHYVRTDRSGARPLPEHLRLRFREAGWITPAPPCDCPEEPAGVVLDPFAGSGTTLATALSLGRRAVGIELNPDYCGLVRERVEKARSDLGMFAPDVMASA